ncbi:MAG: PTS transporter subunit EIIC [Candidatus Elarobacter sp.]
MSPSSAESKPSSASSSTSSNARAPEGDGPVARFERAVAPFAQRFAEAPAVKSLGESLPIAFAFVVVYLIALFWVYPFTSWPDYARDVRVGLPGAFAFASFVMVLVLSFSLSVRLAYPEAPMVGTALLAFCLALPREALGDLVRFAVTHGASGLGAFANLLGASGLFTAIVVSLATAGALAIGRRRLGALAGSVAGALAVLGFSGLLYALHFSFARLLWAIVSPLGTLGDSFVALALITAIEAILWVVGIHGPALLAAIVLPVYWNLQFANTTAAANHEPIPHIVVVSTFLFVFPGGAGATLPLVLLLLRSRVARLRRFAYATILPSLINVNEPVIFGLPLAYNPVLAVPFVVAPVVLAGTTYAALALGLVARPIIYVPSLLPAFLNVFLATLDWRACVLTALNLVIAGAIWLPFVRVYERAEASRGVARAA